MPRDMSEDEIGKHIAGLLRKGNREQYDELQKLVVGALQTGERYYGDMIMSVVWELLPKRAQKKIAVRGKPAMHVR